MLAYFFRIKLCRESENNLRMIVGFFRMAVLNCGILNLVPAICPMQRLRCTQMSLSQFVEGNNLVKYERKDQLIMLRKLVM